MCVSCRPPLLGVISVPTYKLTKNNRQRRSSIYRTIIIKHSFIKTHLLLVGSCKWILRPTDVTYTLVDKKT